MKKTTVILLLFVLAYFAKGQTNQTNFLEKATSDQIKLNSTLINDLVSDIKSNKIQNIHSLLIIKDDKLITEEYFGNRNRESLHYTASVTKSFASALLGIAIDNGFFKDDIKSILEKPVKELFSEYQKLVSQDEKKNMLLLKHILSMTAGLEWDEHSHPYSSSLNDCNKINHATDPMKFLFSRKLIHEPGTEFYYNGGLSLSISYLIEKYSNMPIDKFAEKYLFEPLQIENYRWDNVASGILDTDGGLHLSPIDQAKLGYLFLNNGKWKNKQIVSEEWVKVSSKMHIEIPDSPDYGLQWWGGDFNSFWKTYPVYMASGHGGQKVIVIPEYKMVVVIAQQVFNNPYGDFNFISILSKYILPAVENIELKAIPETNLNKYVGHYISDDSNEFIDISIENNQLVAIANDGSIIRLNKYFKNKFMGTALEILDVYFEFVPDQSGQIEEFNASFGFRDGVFQKSKQH